jgi:hypothetical protein
VASWSLVLAGLVVGITVCVAIGYIVFRQPNPDSNVPDLPPSDAVVKTPPDETSSTQHLSETGTVINHSTAKGTPSPGADLNRSESRRGDAGPDYTSDER